MASIAQVVVLACLLVAASAIPDYTWACTQAGVFCTACNKLTMCVDTGSGYQEVTVATCTGKNTCSHSQKQCTSTAQNPCHNEPVFKCHSQGLFPDPYDCNVYYTCGESTADEYPYKEQHFCPSGTAFDSLWDSCRLDTTHRVCTNLPVPKCNNTVGAGTLPENPTMYYICAEGHPQLYQCENGGKFNSTTFTCDTSTFHCPGIGYFPDTKDCHKWYECSNPEKVLHHTCLIGFYYDQKEKRCILGTCRN